MKFERIHRISNPADMAGEIQRDVIARFHNYKDKEQIREGLKTNHHVKYEETVLQIFPELASETLARRGVLKPLLEQMKIHKIQYSWGFPACLIGCKDGRSATLRFQEESVKFCKRLDWPISEIPGWWESLEKTTNMEEQQQWYPIPKKKKASTK